MILITGHVILTPEHRERMIALAMLGGQDDVAGDEDHSLKPIQKLSTIHNIQTDAALFCIYGRERLAFLRMPRS